MPAIWDSSLFTFSLSLILSGSCVILGGVFNLSGSAAFSFSINSGLFISESSCLLSPFLSSIFCLKSTSTVMNSAAHIIPKTTGDNRLVFSVDFISLCVSRKSFAFRNPAYSLDTDLGLIGCGQVSFSRTPGNSGYVPFSGGFCFRNPYHSENWEVHYPVTLRVLTFSPSVYS